MKKIKYPFIERKEFRENIFGKEIYDPYRWIENTNLKKVKQWIQAENNLAKKFLKKIPYRKHYIEELRKVYFKYSITLPYEIKNDRFFFYKRFPRKNQPILYMSKGNFKPSRARILIDPNKMEQDIPVSLDWFFVSPNAKYVAYGISEGGTELSTLYILDIEKKENFRDKIPDTKWTSLVWIPDSSGFYYARNMSKKGFIPHIFFHKIGTSYKKDSYVYGEELPETYFPYIYGSSDGKYIFLVVSKWGKNDLYFKKIDSDGDFIPIAVDKDGEFIGDIKGDKIIIKTTYKAPRGKLMSVPINSVYEEKWQDLIPEGDRILKNFSITDSALIVEYMKDTFTEIEIYKGKKGSKLKLPEKGTAIVKSYREEDLLYVMFTSFFYPAVIFSYDVNNRKKEDIWKMEADYDPTDYLQKFVFYHSKDGTKIPMYIIYKKGLKRDGKNPLILNGYGGFRIPIVPMYNKNIIPWIKEGGIFAIAGIRGGGEYGDRWHRAGRREMKQNVFDDFISAAEYLIKRRYTSKSKLAITGGSNGGLLMGAVLTQKPTLFKAVVCDVPLLDMIRYHKFSVGYIWKEEYGDPNKEEDFNYLIKYSPYHNIRENVRYPDILFRTAEGDTRVHPVHAMKMAAYLQSISTENVVLLYVEPKAGHGAGKPLKKFIEDEAEKLTFIKWSFER